jgi:hypothetical protein
MTDNELKFGALELMYKAVRSLPGMDKAALSRNPQPSLELSFHDIFIDVRVDAQVEGQTLTFSDKLGRFRMASYDTAVEEIEWNVNFANLRWAGK